MDIRARQVGLEIYNVQPINSFPGQTNNRDIIVRRAWIPAFSSTGLASPSLHTVHPPNIQDARMKKVTTQTPLAAHNVVPARQSSTRTAPSFAGCVLVQEGTGPRALAGAVVEWSGS